MGYIVDTTPTKRKIDDRELKARFLRTTQDGQYLVLVVKSMKSRLIRSTEFVLQPTINHKKRPSLGQRQSNKRRKLRQQLCRKKNKRVKAITNPFPIFQGTNSVKSYRMQLQAEREALAAKAIRIIDKASAPPPAPKKLAKAMASDNAAQ